MQIRARGLTLYPGPNAAADRPAREPEPEGRTTPGPKGADPEAKKKAAAAQAKAEAKAEAKAKSGHGKIARAVSPTLAGFVPLSQLMMPAPVLVSLKINFRRVTMLKVTDKVDGAEELKIPD